MEARTLQFLAEACGGSIRGTSPDVQAFGISTDSRGVAEGDLFIPLRGDRFDAHDFLHQIVGSKPAAALVGREKLMLVPADLPIIEVTDTRQALGQIAARYRKDFDIPTVAVVGSNGKTSTKELLACLLSKSFPTLASPASFNNDIGVPLTMLDLSKSHRAAVFEVGTNHPGELAPLLKMVKPSVGVLTSIGREHLEFFRDIDGVVREEGSIAEALTPSGTLVLNGDCEHSRTIGKRTQARVITVGRETHNEWRILGIQMHENGTTFELKAPDREYSGIYRMGLLGLHQAFNAACAIVVGSILGADRHALEEGLGSVKPAKMRLELKEIGGVTVLDDSYNANADSVRAALRTLASYPVAGGKRIAVLGDMGELGDHSAASHREVGKFAGECEVSTLIAIGMQSLITAESARGAGVRQVLNFETIEEAGDALRAEIQPGDVVLVKASRSSRLEGVVALIEKQFSGEIAASAA